MKKLHKGILWGLILCLPFLWVFNVSAFVPTDIASLEVWLKADAIEGLNDGDDVATWADSSGNGNDATEATNKPTYETAEINGLPVIRFNGTNDEISTAAFGTALTQPNTIFVVYKDPSGTGSEYVYDGVLSTNRHGLLLDGTTPSREVTPYAGASPAGHTTEQNVWHISTIVYSSTSSDVYEDGTAEQTGIDTGTHTLSALMIGSDWNTYFYFGGDIAEILVYDAELSSADITQVEYYLANKYLLPHAGRTVYFVDPDNTNGTYNGAAATPWRGFDDGDDNEDEMDAVDTALGSGDVFVFFSARDDDGDTDETTTVNIQPIRTDGSSNRLTLDGMSHYNTNDGTPAWSTYSGTSRFSVTGNYPLDFHQGAYDEEGDGTARDYITIQGFKINSSGGFAVSIAGSHLIFQDNEVLTSGGQTGPAFYFHYTEIVDHAEMEVAPQTDIIIRRNEIHATYGESIYIGGNIVDADPTGHSYIYIYDNNIYDAGSRGGEGNCIDIKSQNSYVYIYNNRCIDALTDHGIVSLAYDHVYVYNNFVDTPSDTGIFFATNYGTGGSGGVWIHDNVVFDSGVGADGNGICVTTSNAAHAIENVYIYNNTLDGNERGIYIGATGANDITNVLIKNNNVTNSVEYGMKTFNIADPTYENNNVYNSGTSDYTGVGSQTGSNGNISVDPLYVDAGGDDFTLKPGSPARHGAVYIPGYTTKLRPEASWPSSVTTMEDILSIGAYGVYRGAALMALIEESEIYEELGKLI